MLNVYLDKGVKDKDLFKQVLESSRLEINAFFDLDEVPSDKVDVAVIWLNVPNCLKQFSNLKLVLTCGSGIDHIIDSSLLPNSITTIRLVDERLRNKVANYVINAVASYQSSVNESNNSSLTIGIMGLGLVGEKSAKKLMQLGYNVIGWAKSSTKQRLISDVYTGQDGLQLLAKRSQVIVCQLPLTNDTKDVLNRSLFYSMPKGSFVINVGRGGHLNENDLIDLINEGHLNGACLDVIKHEPLPESDILRNQSKIKITPHIAGGIFPEEQAKYAIDVIQKFFNRERQIEGVVDFKTMY
jgi:glyoxylate/hydroxypyruvate reductase A